MNYRRNEVYVSNECRFMLNLYVKQLMAGKGEMTIDQAADAIIINELSTAHPEWTVLWEKREELRQKHKKELQAIEDEVLNLSPELVVEHRT